MIGRLYRLWLKWKKLIILYLEKLCSLLIWFLLSFCFLLPNYVLASNLLTMFCNSKTRSGIVSSSLHRKEPSNHIVFNSVHIISNFIHLMFILILSYRSFQKTLNFSSWPSIGLWTNGVQSIFLCVIQVKNDFTITITDLNFSIENYLHDLLVKSIQYPFKKTLEV